MPIFFYIRPKIWPKIQNPNSKIKLQNPRPKIQNAKKSKIKNQKSRIQIQNTNPKNSGRKVGILDFVGKFWTLDLDSGFWISGGGSGNVALGGSVTVPRGQRPEVRFDGHFR